MEFRSAPRLNLWSQCSDDLNVLCSRNELGELVGGEKSCSQVLEGPRPSDLIPGSLLPQRSINAYIISVYQTVAV